jgi:Ca2+-binding RTX toxin-like protein
MATISGTPGDDTLNGTDFDDTIYGLAGSDSINGNDGNDSLYGDAGNDTLDGGTGIDVMTGGSGADIYVVDNVGDVVIEEQATPVAGVLRVSTDAAGVQGNNVSSDASFSADGRYVVFQSLTSNLVAGDTNNPKFRD